MSMEDEEGEEDVVDPSQVAEKEEEEEKEMDAEEKGL